MTIPRRVRVQTVLVAQPATVMIGSKATKTGIRKQPQPGRVDVLPAGLIGDHVLNVRHHGGPDQAVYVYTQPDLDAWTASLGTAPQPGAFGENVVLDALESADLSIGDRLEFMTPDGTPGLSLEVTAPRIPCATLAANVGDPDFVKRFTQMRRPGAYLRVLRAGAIGAGDVAALRPGPPGAPTIGDLFDLWYDRHPSREFLTSLLAYPLAVRFRRNVEERLARQR
ncbi:MOSC domain-containing protein [Deinococcus sp. KSM4-11]|uniref:MOSC domain-containing protein n=1 Tax=Deinococcus sp. KSM4-11 TaxID=2568654 RepID=UPI001F0D630B|nr:MOSC domain-containing protein [Deinococcus sp. KSM4-11]